LCGVTFKRQCINTKSHIVRITLENPLHHPGTYATTGMWYIIKITYRSKMYSNFIFSDIQDRNRRMADYKRVIVSLGGVRTGTGLGNSKSDKSSFGESILLNSRK
jgi:hypothetical protein